MTQLGKGAHMHAIVVTKPGGPETLESAEVEAPVPGEGELLVRVAAAGVNFIDTYQRGGVYSVDLPFIPGHEGAGRVIAVGLHVDGFAVGARVAWAAAGRSYAEQVVVPAAQAVPIPDGIGDDVAAATLLQGMTAHYLTSSTFPIQSGEIALVHAAAGGVGLMLTQLITSRGGRVIGTVSTAEKEHLAREAGAVEVIRYTEVDDVAAEVRRMTRGAGVAVAYDGVGKATFDASLASLSRRGMLALYGGSSGQVPPFDVQRLNGAGSVFLTRPNLGDYTATRSELLWRAGELFSAIADGTLTVRIGERFRLDEAVHAHRALEGRRTTGKVLLFP